MRELPIAIGKLVFSILRSMWAQIFAGAIRGGQAERDFDGRPAETDKFRGGAHEERQTRAEIDNGTICVGTMALPVTVRCEGGDRDQLVHVPDWLSVPHAWH